MNIRSITAAETDLTQFARFCWLSREDSHIDAFAKPFYFALADSDNDEIV